MRTILYAFLSITLLIPASAPSFAAGKGKQAAAPAAACVRCTVRCSECSGSDSCRNACIANKDPWVKSDAVCGSWYAACPGKSKKK
jgi:hypothetical protein